VNSATNIRLNTHNYDNIAVGHTEKFTVLITEEMQQLFHTLSGDINPMHIDSAYAESKGFSGRLVYGMLTASFYSTLVGTLLPGEKCLFQEADLKFNTPVYIGDVLEITGECIDKNDTFKRLTIKAKVRNEKGEVVSSAKLKVGMLDE